MDELGLSPLICNKNVLCNSWKSALSFQGRPCLEKMPGEMPQTPSGAASQPGQLGGQWPHICGHQAAVGGNLHQGGQHGAARSQPPPWSFA